MARRRHQLSYDFPSRFISARKEKLVYIFLDERLNESEHWAQEFNAPASLRMIIHVPALSIPHRQTRIFYYEIASWRALCDLNTRNSLRIIHCNHSDCTKDQCCQKRRRNSTTSGSDFALDSLEMCERNVTGRPIRARELMCTRRGKAITDIMSRLA